MKTKLSYFVHGTTVDNENNISSGWSDVELSDLGIKQSIELWEKIKARDFDIVFCSDLKRAVHSADLVFGGKVQIIQDKRLRECNYGEYNGSPSTEVDKIREQIIDDRFPSGESYKDVEARMKSFLDDLVKSYKGKSVAIVSHQGPQLALDVLLKGMSWEEALKNDWRKTKSWQPGWTYVI